MKNLIRVFVVSLVATGAYASVQTPSSTSVVAPRPSAMPVPSCGPGRGTCNFCNNGANC